MAAVSTKLTVKYPGKILNFTLLYKKFTQFLYSNTRVKLFVKFAEATEPFRQIVNTTSKPNAVEVLKQMPSDQCCPLSYAADMLLMLTNGLMSHPDVVPLLGRVSSASFDDDQLGWNVEMLSEGETRTVSSSLLIFCTGSSPINPSLPVKIAGTQALDLDIALTPTLLSQEIPKQPTTIAVIGASHSAILVLMNLYKLASSTHPDLKIKWFTRHELKYAEYMDDGWILRDNTGLKGDTAAWARENLEPEKFSSSKVSKYITKIEYKRGLEAETYVQHMPGCDRYVQAIGYNRDEIPKITKRVKGSEEEVTIEAVFNSNTGGFEDEKGEKIKGLYGAGIAFPERVTDPYGNAEHAVGFWKFMKFVKQVVKDWK